jgi:beta-N-acetylhexosaminidase
MIRRSLVVLAVLATALFAGPIARADTDPPLSELSTKQLAGQRVIYSYSAFDPPKLLLSRIRRGEAAGVIFFRQNIDSRSQVRKVVEKLQAARLASPIHAPLLIMTDQEGGVVKRLAGPPELSAKQVGEAPDATGQAKLAGMQAGQNLRGAGFNVNLAPVLDVFRTPGNFIDRFGRSFSSNQFTVSRLGTKFLKAQQRTGVAATAKHFPGLGAATTDQDTDAVPVTLDLSSSAVRDVDMRPYPTAIDAGVRLVMASWAKYPALDPDRPAGLSKFIIQRELRERQGFDGVTITDGIEAGALKDFGGPGNRSVLAADAGMDLMLFSNKDIDEGEDGLRALTHALREGDLSRPTFQASVERILALREALNSQKPLPAP